jgi:uncharacterized membrane protein
MKNRLYAFWDRLSASYWFIPALMAVIAVVLSIVAVQLDERVGHELRWVTGLVYVDSVEGARAVMSTVASSMITVAGVVFSLTMVVLSLTSQQYGSLVLTYFMRDRGNQFVLGVFTSTFLYCLLVLRTIRGEENQVFIAHISVLIGLGLAVVSLAVLIYFIHHVSQAIQAPNIIARISDELAAKIEHQFPAEVGKEITPTLDEAQQKALFERIAQESAIIATRESGYLQMIDVDALLRTARSRDLIISLEVMPGQYMFKGQPLARVLQSDPAGSVADAVQDAFIFGSLRTSSQDIEFIFTQLSALAVRALSASINDPYTVLMAIDHLGTALCSVLQRQQPSMYRYDQDDNLRVIAYAATFQTLFHTAFDQIAHYGIGDPNIATRLLQVFKTLWDCAGDPPTRELLRRYATHVYEESLDRLTDSEDARINQVFAAILREFNGQPQPRAR